jgi:hypothetical protein
MILAALQEHAMRDSLTQMLVWVMVSVLPAQMASGQTAFATLTSTGEVTVNGAPAGQSTAVFAGDRVQTGANGAATLSAQGSSIVLPGGSDVVIGANQISLGCGSVDVVTSSGMPVQVGDFTISPTSGTVRFGISHQNGRLLVTSRDGSLNVSHAGRVSTLTPGQTAEEPAPGCGEVAQQHRRVASPTAGGNNGAILLGVAATGAWALSYT